jgi:predicted RNase H-like HicB family nuclease
MDITLQIHLDAADKDFVWWAESDQLPGVTAAAGSLMEMREELDHVLADLSAESGDPIVVTTEILADSGPQFSQSVVVESDRAPESIASTSPMVKVLSPAS